MTAPGRCPERSWSAEAASVAHTLTVEPPDQAMCYPTRQPSGSSRCQQGTVARVRRGRQWIRKRGGGSGNVARVRRERTLRLWLADVYKVPTEPEFGFELQDAIGLQVRSENNAPVLLAYFNGRFGFHPTYAFANSTVRCLTARPGVKGLMGILCSSAPRG